MTKLEQAARQALEALESCEEDYIYDGENEYECDSIDWDKRNAAIAALREALAEQAEQEPVAWMNDSTPMGVFARHKEGAENFGCTIPLYTRPIRTKDLTDDEIYKLADDVDWAAGAYLGFARAVIAADRERNK